MNHLVEEMNHLAAIIYGSQILLLEHIQIDLRCFDKLGRVQGLVQIVFETLLCLVCKYYSGHCAKS